MAKEEHSQGRTVCALRLVLHQLTARWLRLSSWEPGTRSTRATVCEVLDITEGQTLDPGANAEIPAVLH